MLLKDPARVLGETLAKSPGPATVRIEAWTYQAQASGMGEHQIEMLVKMFHYYDRHGFRGNPRTPSHLLGRTPTKFETFVERVMR
jgi:hypothetical protein